MQYVQITRYQVNKKYKIENNNIIHIRTNRIVLPFLKKDGYYYINLCDITNKPKTYLFHRLLAQTLIPNPQHKKFVSHLNKNKQDNCINNLAWTNSEGRPVKI